MAQIYLHIYVYCQCLRHGQSVCQFINVKLYYYNLLLRGIGAYWFLPRCIERRRGLAMRILSVRLSVRSSDKRVNCDKREEKSVQIFIPYERSFTYSFMRKRMVGGGDHFYMKFWVNRPPSVRPSVCPFVWQTRELWQNGRKISPDFYTVRKVIYL